MTSKAEITKQHILATAAHIINVKGIAATSLGDITQATGLTKGAIYGHFKDKDELALKTFEYNLEIRMTDLINHLDLYADPQKKLLGLLDYYRTDFIIKFWKSGGCPIINTSVEVDDQFPLLRQAVTKTISGMRKALVKILEEIQANNTSAIQLDTQHYASVIFTSIQGALLVTKTTGDTSFLHHTLHELERMIKRDILHITL